jgi:hypothetical protein
MMEGPMQFQGRKRMRRGICPGALLPLVNVNECD